MSRYKAYLEYKDSQSKWLSDIPRSWNLFDGKRLFSSRRESALENDEQLAASQKHGVIPQNLMMELNDSKVMLALKGTSSFRHVNENDFVISLRSFEGGIEHSNYAGCVSPAYTVLRSEKTIVPAYFKYLLKSAPYIAALQASTDSLRDGKSISYEQFGAIPLPYPVPDEQHAIATFLEHETGKIDALIEKQQRLIELLKEKRQAVISHAVTKGLNPNTPMKDSGVEWLGEVPAHWNTPKLLSQASRIGDGLHAAPQYQDGTEIYFINGNNLIDGNIIIGTTAKEVPVFEYEKNYIHLNGSSVLLSINGTIGNVALYNEEKIILGKSAAYINCLDSLLSKYLMLFLQSDNSQRYYEQEVTGTTIYNLSLNSIRKIKVPIPPKAEQKEIVVFCARQKNKYATLIEQASNAINLMQERRTALIAAAVTGKIDVRDWQPAAA